MCPKLAPYWRLASRPGFLPVFLGDSMDTDLNFSFQGSARLKAGSDSTSYKPNSYKLKTVTVR